MIAEVIVDVAAYPIDRPFDYLVPEALESVIEPGTTSESTVWTKESAWLCNEVEG